MNEHEWNGIPIETYCRYGIWVAKVPGGCEFSNSEEFAVANLKQRLSDIAALITPALEQQVRELEEENRILREDADPDMRSAAKLCGELEVLRERARRVNYRAYDELKAENARLKARIADMEERALHDGWERAEARELADDA